VRRQAPVETPVQTPVQTPEQTPDAGVPPAQDAPVSTPVSPPNSAPAQPAEGQAPPPVALPEDPAARARVAPRDDVRAAPGWDGAPPVDATAFAARLAELAAAYPETLSYASAGRDARGGEVWYATLTRAPVEERARLPALLCAPRSLHGGDAASATALLHQCAGLADAAAEQPVVAEALAHAVVHALFWLRPDRAFVNAPARPEELDFPAGWTFASAARPFPLADAETRAVAKFVLQHPEIAIAAWSSDADLAPEPSAFVLVDAAAGAGGSFERFVDEYLGVSSVRLFRAGAAPAETRALASAGFPLLLRALPHLAAVRERTERLQPDVWAFDVRIANAGLAGTLEGSASVRELSSVRASLSGGELAGAALGSGAGFEPVPVRAGRVELGHLAGGAARTLRVFVRGAPGANARLELTSLRAGSASVALSLE
jgi:hypothetical protein